MRCGKKNVYKLLAEYNTKMKAMESRSRSVDLSCQHNDERDRDRRKDDWDSGEDDWDSDSM
jgi:hypothetical protein